MCHHEASAKASGPLETRSSQYPRRRAEDLSETEADKECSVTYSLLAVDRQAGLIGVVTASRSLAVGNSVPAIDPAVGAVVTQAWTNRRLKARALEALRVGLSPDEVIGMVPAWDDGFPLRQLAVLDVNGGGAHFTGDGCTQWAGGRSIQNAVAVGNLLTGADVIDAMCSSFAGSDPNLGDSNEQDSLKHFATRLLDALAAGEAAGGDARGRESAAIQVAHLANSSEWPPELAVDLRADHDPEPVDRLQELLVRRFAAAEEEAPDDVSAEPSAAV
jgi:uncharacterized Ntn-hydrolase superfamily protein